MCTSNFVIWGQRRIEPHQPLVAGRHHLDLRVQRLKLGKETKLVRAVFKALGYTVKVVAIEMTESHEEARENITAVLNKFLAKSPQSDNLLQVFHYHGHGLHGGWASSRSRKYKLTYVKATTLPAVVGKNKWSCSDKLLRLLNRMATKMLLMKPSRCIGIERHCCEAGFAMLNNEGTRPTNTSRKEVIGACVWAINTQDQMSPALCKVLGGIRKKSQDMSTDTIIQKMNKILSEKPHVEESEIQRSHSVTCSSGQKAGDRPSRPEASIQDWKMMANPDDN
ncbi:uncharacterized protein CC84DRAFT_1176427 [Paraphaeosphaeria sporulosa]|uniref:Uncharacterized protein n=1 Tax=Paraphaeosphaeria sporulosa TaxID=1460663 RepID=A0A177CGS6_9PLEO|nr:uncharacterized protein CC84DRAFT_1176427 [Paraphaeosphaeria sporulosa]OAG06431.1 hypothetical protein CC84DRAFT_1176427 [Paraphaeosphaeria sporulosa]